MRSPRRQRLLNSGASVAGCTHSGDGRDNKQLCNCTDGSSARAEKTESSLPVLHDEVQKTIFRVNTYGALAITMQSNASWESPYCGISGTSCYYLRQTYSFPGEGRRWWRILRQLIANLRLAIETPPGQPGAGAPRGPLFF
ncbi:hypothetical protein BDW66DRAFT_133980 [Aspergillus desertorum]